LWRRTITTTHGGDTRPDLASMSQTVAAVRVPVARAFPFSLRLRLRGRRGHVRLPWHSIAWCLAVCFATLSCRRDPNVKYVRGLEAAASWASSVQFTSELVQDRRVPASFVHDVLTTGSRELKTIDTAIAGEEGVPSQSRQQASLWCRRLMVLFEESGRSGAIPDARKIREIEGRLRAAARDARAGGTVDSRP
jgi:hypothetical protein